MRNPASYDASQLADMLRELQDIVFGVSDSRGRLRYRYDNGIDGESALEQTRTLLEDNGLAPRVSP